MYSWRDMSGIAPRKRSSDHRRCAGKQLLMFLKTVIVVFGKFNEKCFERMGICGVSRALFDIFSKSIFCWKFASDCDISFMQHMDI